MLLVIKMKIIKASHALEEQLSFSLQRNNGGQNYLYSNFGYMLLSLIIEKASGKSHEQFLKKNFSNACHE